MALEFGVASECQRVYEGIQAGDIQYVTYKLDDSKSEIPEIIVEQVEDQNNWEGFISRLKKDEPRYAVYNFQFEREGVAKKEVVFIYWVPEDASMKYKMLYSAAKQSLKRSLGGVGTEIAASDLSQLSYEPGVKKIAG